MTDTRKRLHGSALIAMLVALCILGGGQSGVAADEPTAVAAFGLLPGVYNPTIPESRSYFIYSAPPGTTITSIVRVQNNGTAAGTVHLYAVDGITSDNTGAVYRSDSDPREDTGAWITIPQDFATLQMNPGEERSVPFTVTIPTKVRPGQHLGGIVAENGQLSTSAESGGAAVSIKSRAILAVQITLPGDKVEQLSASSVTPAGEQGYQQLRLALRNDGTYMVKPTGTLKVKDLASGLEVQNIPIHMDTFLPQNAINYPAAVRDQALDVGDYEAQLDLTFGDHGALHYTTHFSISKQQVKQAFAAPVSQPLAAPASVAQSRNAGQSSATGNTSAQGLSDATSGAGAGVVGSNIMPILGGGVLVVILLATAFVLGRRGRRT